MSNQEQKSSNQGGRPELSRRELLKLAGLGAGALLSRPGLVWASSGGGADDAASMLYDATRCIGCRACETACKEWNDLPEEPERPSDTTARTWTLIKQYQEGPVESFRKYQCLHCLDPACVSVCTVGALSKTEAGPVVYDQKKCIGCRYCQYACPFGVPKFEWNEALGLIGKCTFCADRIAEGRMPACAEACPTEALTFGTREEMLAEARSRIDQHPDRYIDHIYGETEAGGTSVLFLSAVPFEKLGFPSLGPEPVARASVFVSKATPGIFFAAATVFSGIYWLTKRVKETQEEN